MTHRDLIVQRGFTMIELAIVVLISGLLLAGVASIYHNAFTSNQYASSQDRLDTVKQAVLNFVSFTGHMPCPDTDGDGRENRNGNSCQAAFGDIPYKDIQIPATAVKDSYGTNIRYAVTPAAVSEDPCASQTASSSYFCPGTPPVFSKTAADGEISVCDTSVSSTCSATSTSTIDGVVGVLVAQNKDGQMACGDLSSGQEQENCDLDEYFFMGPLTDTKSDSMFDDQIMTISPLEVKSSALKTGYVSDASDSQINGGRQSPDFSVSPLNPNAADVLVVNGDLNRNQRRTLNRIRFSGQDPKVLIAGDVNTTLSGSQNSDYIQVDRNLNGKFVGKRGQDLILVKGSINGGANTGQGDDKVEVYGSLNGRKLVLGSGNDMAYIHGDVRSNVESGRGDDKIRIDGNIYADINGGSGKDTLYLNMSKSDYNANPNLQSKIKNFETIVFLK